MLQLRAPPRGMCDRLAHAVRRDEDADVVPEQRAHGLLLHRRQVPAESESERLAVDALVDYFEGDTVPAQQRLELGATGKTGSPAWRPRPGPPASGRSHGNGRPSISTPLQRVSRTRPVGSSPPLARFRRTRALPLPRSGLRGLARLRSRTSASGLLRRGPRVDGRETKGCTLDVSTGCWRRSGALRADRRRFLQLSLAKTRSGISATEDGSIGGRRSWSFQTGAGDAAPASGCRQGEWQPAAEPR